MNMNPATLFVGDLSIFCTNEDLEREFSKFGQLVDVRIKRDENTNKNLSYGFVKYASFASAELALSLNGFLLCGRPLRINWATNRILSDRSLSDRSIDFDRISPPVDVFAPVGLATKTSVHPGIVVTEEVIRNIFVSYGDIVDVTIKKATIVNSVSVKGFGFVHFRDDLLGMRSAVHAVNSLSSFICGDVSYRCTLSRELVEKIKQDGYIHDDTPPPLSLHSLTKPSAHNGTASAAPSHPSFDVSPHSVCSTTPQAYTVSSEGYNTYEYRQISPLMTQENSSLANNTIFNAPTGMFQASSSHYQSDGAQYFEQQQQMNGQQHQMYYDLNGHHMSSVPRMVSASYYYPARHPTHQFTDQPLLAPQVLQQHPVFPNEHQVWPQPQQYAFGQQQQDNYVAFANNHSVPPQTGLAVAQPPHIDYNNTWHQTVSNQVAPTALRTAHTSSIDMSTQGVSTPQQQGPLQGPVLPVSQQQQRPYVYMNRHYRGGVHILNNTEKQGSVKEEVETKKDNKEENIN